MLGHLAARAPEGAQVARAAPVPAFRPKYHKADVAYHGQPNDFSVHVELCRKIS